ncbi:MAG: hypothetical protein B7Z27_07285 [Sphingobacteriia bacterium 32-37-4]|nr:MAG: hypothetical protein B7Z27_07285 [Sphingobacteriia bacterium 32-37-4]
MVVEFFIKFFNYAPFEASDNGNTAFEYIETGIMVLVLVTVSIGVLGLIQQFFTKELPRSIHAKDASAAKQLIKIDTPQQVGAQLLLFAVASAYSKACHPYSSLQRKGFVTSPTALVQVGYFGRILPKLLKVLSCLARVLTMDQF